MRRSTKRFSSFVISLVLFLISAVVYFALISPAYDNLQLTRQDEASRAQFVQNEQASVKKVQNLISTYQGETTLVDTVSQALPQSPDISGALLQLNGIAQITGMSPRQFTVTQALIPNQTTSGNKGSTSISTNNSPLGANVTPMGTLTFHVQLSGTYEGFKDFVKDIETNIRIFNFQNVAINPATQSAAGKSTGADAFNFDVTIVAYYQSQGLTLH